MPNKYMRALRSMAKHRALDAESAQRMIEASMEDAEWREELHPRGKGGKFARKGSGSVSGGGAESGGGSSKMSGSSAFGFAGSLKKPSDLKGQEITLVNKHGDKTIIRESKEDPNEFETENYMLGHTKPIMGSMSLGALKNELKAADPEKTELAPNGSNKARAEELAKIGTRMNEEHMTKVKQVANRKALKDENMRQADACFAKMKDWPEGSEEHEILKRYSEILSKPLSGRPTPEKSKQTTQKFLSNISSKLKPYAVERYKKDLANEPQITNDICDIADALGTSMFGLDYRLKKASDNDKGVCRVAEKIETDIAEAAQKGYNMSYEEAVDNLGDLVRYTQACTGDNLEENANKTIKMLEEKGYKCVKVKNTWESYNEKFPYRGVNCAFVSPTGTKFELQFHTPESLVCKELQHGWYEEARTTGTAPERIAELNKRMFENSKRMKAPKNVGRLESFKTGS